MFARLCLVAALALPAARADSAPRQPTSFAFTVDLNALAERGSRMSTDNFTSLARLAFWGKDALASRAPQPGWAPTWLLACGRAFELIAADTPLAILAQTFPHEIDGHGGRVREVGGVATYRFEPPFPYGVQTSVYEDAYPRPLTPDERAFVAQGGLAMEGYQRLQTLAEAFEAGTWSHGEAFLYFGWSLHLAGYGARDQGDAANWSRAQADRYGGSARVLRQRYLLAATLAEGLDPLFLYSLWTLGRFVARGERFAEAPGLDLGRGVRGWLSTHLDPVPWGSEVRLDVLLRPPFALLDVAPRVGFGPGGTSGGLAISMHGLRVYGPIHLGVQTEVWLQPDLAIFPVAPGEPLAVGLPGPEPLPARWGVAGELEVAYRAERWFAGLRVGGKSRGVRGVDPFAASGQASLRLGVRLP